ncbi:hypothetical protein ACE2AJ_09675 [Aquihabitans daechungensis]|uniref:hypothetical protein n=1 Tax=Aquihabitans daechungensis TaxID=1052257 RepID=UPI003BA31B78
MIAPLLVVAACSSGGSDAATTTAAPSTTAATTTTEVTIEAAGEDFQALIEAADETIADESTTRDEFAEESDVEGAVGSAAGLRDDLEDFQAELADLEVPADARDAIDEVDEATTAYVDALAGYEDVETVDEYNEVYDEEIAVDEDWHEAVAEAAEVFEVDGIEGTASSDPGDSDADEPEADDSDDAPAAAGAIEGDGSEYCLQDGDLPDAFLPLTGKDNMSNALSYSFEEGPEAEYADALVASWMVLPEGGAGPDDLTADCLIHIFDSADSAEGFYDAWTSDYGATSMPVPEQAEVAEGAPGEDPQAYTKLVGDRPTADQIFRYENVVVSVGISGTSSNDFETLLEGTNDLAVLVYDRLEAAG